MRTLAHILVYSLGILCFLPGCVSPWTTGSTVGEEAAELADSMEAASEPEFVGDLARPSGLTVLQAESLGVVNGLPGTGGAPQPSPQLSEMLRELRTYDVASPSHFLESDTTALVTVTALLPPGARKGDPVDLQVQLSRQANASDISGGWLMPVRLRQMRVLGGMIRDGDVLALGNGRVIASKAIDGSLGDDGAREGIIPGGGRVVQDRELGLQLQIDPSLTLSERQQVINDVCRSINSRFSFFNGQGRLGIAQAKNDGYIAVSVFPRYSRNIHRQMNVVQAISLSTEAARPEGLALLRDELHDPVTARQAALKLEAVGESAITTLQSALTSQNPELRFYAAEALAYLNDESALPVLAQLIREEVAFRHSGLLAIGTMDHPMAGQTLASLMHDTSNEVRFGAHRELVEREDARGLVARRTVEGVDITVVPSQSAPLVAASTIRRPGIVIFGAPLQLDTARTVYVNEGLTVRGEQDGRIRISRFAPGAPDTRVLVPATVEGCVDGLLQVGAPISEVLDFLRHAKNQNSLPARFAINPIPETGRIYHRDESDEAESKNADGDKIARTDESESKSKTASPWFPFW